MKRLLGLLLVLRRFDQHADSYRCTTMKYLAALLVMVTFCGCGGGRPQTLKGHTNRVGSVAFSPDGQRIVSGSFDQTVKIWDANTDKELQTLKGHTNSVTSVAFSPDGQRIVSGSEDKTVKIWDARE